MRHPISKPHVHGFTLVELLVVIAIIGILSAILFPVISSALRRGKMSPALNNSRQIGQGMIMYANDRKDTLPREKAVSDSPSWNEVKDPANADVWYNAVLAVTDQATAAQMAEKPESFYTTNSSLFIPGARYPSKTQRLTRPYFAIAINSKLMGDKPIRRHIIARPTHTVFVLESGLPNEKAFAVKGQDHTKFQGQPHVFASRFVTRYDKRGVLTFCDGHAEALVGSKVVAPSGNAFFPVPAGGIIWTPDPTQNPN